ncbi:MAG: hypothetical protein JW788_00345 [Candidatus Omnitrophica bacterium]|nr:hypothetical protein [Candidatus Omnitrophota bacterium]
MDEKKKFLITVAAFGAALLMAVFFILQIYNAKVILEREKEILVSENTSLGQKVEGLHKDKKALEEKITALENDLGKITQQKDAVQKERDEARRQCELIIKEKEELLAEIDDLRLKQSPGTEKTDSNISFAQDAYWAQVLKEKTDLAAQIDSLRAELRDLHINNEQLKAEKSSLELDFSNILREKQDFEQQLKKLDVAAYELLQEKNTNFQLRDNIKSIKGENSNLRKELKILTNYKLRLEGRIKQLEEEREGLERKFNEMQIFLENRLSQASDIRSELDNLRYQTQKETKSTEQKKDYSAIELPPIVVRPAAEGASDSLAALPGFYAGKIISVNRENNFVIIDLGQDDGVRRGDIFKIYRKNQEMGTIEVIQVRKDISACDIKEENVAIKAGDSVK